MVKTKYGSLNISIYAIARYLNQLPGHQTWQDHLGRDRDFLGRNDFFWHRTMIWFSGWLGTPKAYLCGYRLDSVHNTTGFDLWQHRL
jgi:hypothetical protein